MQKRGNPQKVGEPLSKDKQHTFFIQALKHANGDGVKKDQIEAVRLYRLSADQGHANAQYHLGVCYEEGRGVGKEMKEAARWYRLAADQGHAIAQNNLGVCYKEGSGVEKDIKEAVRLYRLAADQGCADAQNNLGFYYAHGNDVEKDLKEAVRLYKLAAGQGHADAQYNLGFCYEIGRGVEKDLKEAERLYHLAANQGNASAQFALAFIRKRKNYVVNEVKENKVHYGGLPGAIDFLLRNNKEFTQYLIEFMQCYGQYKDPTLFSREIMEIINAILKHHKEIYGWNAELAAVILNYPNLYLNFSDKQILDLANEMKKDIKKERYNADAVINALKTGRLPIENWWKIFDSLKDETIEKDIINHLLQDKNDPRKKALIIGLGKYKPKDGIFSRNSRSALMLICIKYPICIDDVLNAVIEDLQILSAKDMRELALLKSVPSSSAEQKTSPTDSTPTELEWSDIHAFVQAVCKFDQPLFLSDRDYTLGKTQDEKKNTSYAHLSPEKRALLDCMVQHLNAINSHKEISKEQVVALFLTLLNDDRYNHIFVTIHHNPSLRVRP